MYFFICGRYHYELPSKLFLSSLRPRAYKKIKLENVEAGESLMVNYNIDDPEDRGYWYHAKVRQMWANMFHLF